MTTKNYKIVIPISTTQCLEVIPKLYPIDSKLQSEQLSNFKVIESESSNFENSTVIIPNKNQHTEILRILRTAHKGLSRFFEKHETFIAPTTNGYQLIRSNQILYFEYSKSKKQWVAVLTNFSCIILKNSTTAKCILEYSNSYLRINQQCIINLNHLQKIELNQCILSIQPNNTKLIVSRSYLKILQESIRVI